jgi:nucleoside-triphosphatase THEP1
MIYVTIYLTLRESLELLLLSLPAISLSIYTLLMFYIQSGLDTISSSILGIQITAGLAIARYALKGRRKSTIISINARKIMLDIVRNLKIAPYISMISLGVAIVAIAFIDLILVLLGVTNGSILLINPVTMLGIVVASLIIPTVNNRHSISRILIPIGSWGSTIYLYTSMIHYREQAILGEGLKSIELPGIYLEKSARLRISIDTASSPHIVISGNTGSGKTTLCKILAEGLRRGGIGVIVIDYHGEYRGLEGFRVIDASESSPQILLNTLDEGKALELVDSIRKIFRLGALQVSILSTIAVEMIRRGGKSFKDLLTVAEEILEKSKEDPKTRELLLSIIPYLRILATHIRGEPIDIETAFVREGRHIILDMSNIGSEYASTIYIEYLLKQIWRHKISTGQKREVDLVIIIDEAHNLLRGSAEEFISKIFRESRKYGLSLVISTQQFEKLPSEIINNAGMFFFLRQTDPRVIDVISGFIAYDEVIKEEIKRALRSLEPLQGIIYVASKRVFHRINISIGSSLDNSSSF